MTDTLFQPPGSGGDIVEISGSEVILRRGLSTVMKVGLADFVRTLAQQMDTSALPDGSPLPDSVRFVHSRGNSTVLVMELPPQVRQVRWISSSSPVPFGPGSKYESITLAFPYIVIVVLFSGGNLTGYQQLFYRSEAIGSDNDPLYLPNLLNVAEGYGLKTWLCLANMNVAEVAPLPWNQKVRRLVEHFWEAGFNRSSEYHEFNSYWQKMTEARLDPRISSVESWQQATQEDPLFMLKVKWKPAGLTVRQVSASMLAHGCAPSSVSTSSELVTLICSAASHQANPALYKSFGTKLKKLLG